MLANEAQSVGQPPVLLSIGTPGTADAGVARITLNRPDQFNALSGEMLAALDGALAAIEGDLSVRVAILAGAGRAFCAGHDLREMRALGDEAALRDLFDRCSGVMQRIERMPQVVIARVHGVATAAGCQLVAACDLAVATDSARFATSGITLGLFCATPAVALLRTVARKHAAELLYSGDFISAAVAERIGLVNRVTTSDRLDEEVFRLATRIAGHSGAALAIGKRLLAQLAQSERDEQYPVAAATMARNMTTADAQAGIDAFIGKQPLPVWTHR